ncbi:hypothetical protein C8R43DRAFT_942398 [Mycena crocata]|nr:hypothetical protein C8R43DRAFT_942398 [Mycena crocata]
MVLDNFYARVVSLLQRTGQGCQIDLSGYTPLFNGSEPASIVEDGGGLFVVFNNTVRLRRRLSAKIVSVRFGDQDIVFYGTVHLRGWHIWGGRRWIERVIPPRSREVAEVFFRLIQKDTVIPLPRFAPWFIEAVVPRPNSCYCLVYVTEERVFRVINMWALGEGIIGWKSALIAPGGWTAEAIVTNYVGCGPDGARISVAVECDVVTR